jgi:uncharacterized protein (TIGR00266 family)
MKISIEGKPSFAYINVTLEPGEFITAESDAMASMDICLDMKARLNGNLFSAVSKKYLGKESLIVNDFVNPTNVARKLTLVQGTPGDIIEKVLDNETYCLQPGSYIASSPGIKLGLKWAGLASWIGGEGLFKLVVTGTGSVLIGAYGGLVEKQIEGEYIVDTSHLVAYEPQMKLSTQLAGGLFSSFFGGEGFVTRVSGTGKIVIQTRSLSGLAGWLNRNL